MKKHRYSGSSFDDFLKEEGIFEEVKTLAKKELEAARYKRYPIVTHKDPDTDYCVTVPDLPGCITAGNTLDDAQSQAAEAIQCHIEGMLLYNESIPQPRDIAFHQHNPDYADGQWKSVTVVIRDVSKIQAIQPGPIRRFFRWFSQATQVLR